MLDQRPRNTRSNMVLWIAVVLISMIGLGKEILPKIDKHSLLTFYITSRVIFLFCAKGSRGHRLFFCM